MAQNLATTNYADFDDKSKELIWQQVLQAVSIASNKTSVSLLITVVTGGTSPTTAGTGHRRRKKPIVFPYMSKCLKPRPIIQFSQLPSRV